MKYTLRNIQTGANGTLIQEDWHLHCLQVLQHLSFALFGQQLSDHCFTRVVLLKVSWSLNLLDVVGQVEVAREDPVFIWNDGAKEYFSRCFEYVLEMVSLIDTVPSMPWIAARQQHQINADSDAPFNYYRKSMCLPLLDHLINRINERFNKYGKTILMMQALILSAFAERDVTIDGIVKV